MGRRRSDLPGFILRLAAKNREALPERLRKEYERHAREWEEERAFCTRMGLEQPPPPDRFAPAFRVDLQPEITAAEVVKALDPDAGHRRSVQASVSRAFTRLIRAGLLQRIGDGLRITEAGLALLQIQAEPEPTEKKRKRKGEK